MRGYHSPQAWAFGRLTMYHGGRVLMTTTEKDNRVNSYILKTITETKTEFRDYETSVWII